MRECVEIKKIHQAYERPIMPSQSQGGHLFHLGHETLQLTDIWDEASTFPGISGRVTPEFVKKTTYPVITFLN